MPLPLERMYVYDIETYKDLFSFSIVRVDGKHKKTFAVCKYRNDSEALFKALDYLWEKQCYLVGFNNIGFDYPVVHKVIQQKSKLPKSGILFANRVFKFAQDQIDSFKGDGFGNTIKKDEVLIPQVDLYKVWHFNNKAKSTSLKLLEFNMRMQNIEDLPYDINKELSEEEVNEILAYNEHDVECTRQFFWHSKTQLEFRFDLSEKLGRDFTSADDTKIGSDYFQMKLEEEGIQVKEYKDGKLVLRQSKRDKIKISECLLDYYNFNHKEFQAVHDWFSRQVITETKGVFSDLDESSLGDLAQYAEMQVKRQRFKSKPSEEEIASFKKEHPLGWVETEELKATEYAFDENGQHILEYVLDEDGCPDLSKKPKKKRIPKLSYWGCWKEAGTLNTVVDGFRIDFGVGGVHASLSNKRVKETGTYFIRDADVSSMYPNISISNRLYPEHLGEPFFDVYRTLYQQRKNHAKGTPENAMIKLSMNSVYGKSNDKFSFFYDPKFTMQITINGQLSLLMLCDMLLEIEGLKLIQLNTDGITVACRRDKEEEYVKVCDEWQKRVKLELEFADYSKMLIRDVNSYIAVYTNGKIKRKGAYQYQDLGWHQNQSALVIPMAAESAMLNGTDPMDFIKKHYEEGNIFDFMLRTKVPRSSTLWLEYEDGTKVQQQRICRYYPSENGGHLVKVMPAIAGKEEAGPRNLSLDANWKVKTCNNMQDFDGDINLLYYAEEAKKLIVC